MAPLKLTKPTPTTALVERSFDAPVEFVWRAHTDPTLVKGTHGRLYEDPDCGPVFVSSSKEGAADVVAATEVRDRMLTALAR